VSQEWYYSIDGDRQGPITGAELKKLAEAGTLKSADLVWKDGMTDWVPAKSIKGLFGAAGPAAPSASKTGEQAAARSRPVADGEEDRPARSRRRDDDDEEDRPRRRRDDDEDEDERPARSRGRDEEEADEDDRRVRRRDEDDQGEQDEDRPRKKRRRVPEDTANKKMVAGLLGILLGGFAVHKFYLGFTSTAVIQLLISIFTCGLGGWLGLIEGIIYLTKSDEDFYQTYIVEEKQWF
jgi:TM2 domain-containing membrane protein YozV